MTLTCLDSKLVISNGGEIAEIELEKKMGANYVDVNRSHFRQWRVNPEPRSGMREIPYGAIRIRVYCERGMSTSHYRIHFLDENGNTLKVGYL
jgi:hypothetical protein